MLYVKDLWETEAIDTMSDYYGINPKVFDETNLILKSDNEFLVFEQLSRVVIALNVDANIISSYLNKEEL